MIILDISKYFINHSINDYLFFVQLHHILILSQLKEIYIIILQNQEYKPHVNYYKQHKIILKINQNHIKIAIQKIYFLVVLVFIDF